MIRLDGIGHVLLRVIDVEAARKFYTTILGLKVVEEDPEHGGIFMALEGTGHTVDLFPCKDPDVVRGQTPGERGVAHVAFKVSSDAALQDVTPHDDALASAWYRSKVLPVLVRRALTRLQESS